MSFAIRFFLCCKSTSDDSKDPAVKKSDLTPADKSSKPEESKNENDLAQNRLTIQADQPYKELSFSDLNAINPQNCIIIDQEKREPLSPSSKKYSQEKESNLNLTFTSETKERNRTSTMATNNETSSNTFSVSDPSKAKLDETNSKQLKGGMVLKKIVRREKEPGLQENSSTLHSGHKNTREVLNSTPVMRSATLKI